MSGIDYSWLKNWSLGLSLEKRVAHKDKNEKVFCNKKHIISSDHCSLCPHTGDHEKMSNCPSEEMRCYNGGEAYCVSVRRIGV